MAIQANLRSNPTPPFWTPTPPPPRARWGGVRLETGDGVDEAVLQERGFALERKLAWMDIRLRPTSTNLANGG